MDDWTRLIKEESTKTMQYLVRTRRIKYFKDHWIAIAALILSIIALIKK